MDSTNAIGKEFVPEVGGWFLSTKGLVDSKDVRRHVDWLLDRLAGKDDALRTLQAEGYKINIFCFRSSADGNGRPVLSPAIMKRLGELEIEIGFDVYGPFDD